MTQLRTAIVLEKLALNTYKKWKTFGDTFDTKYNVVRLSYVGADMLFDSALADLSSKKNQFYKCVY